MMSAADSIYLNRKDALLKHPNFIICVRNVYESNTYIRIGMDDKNHSSLHDSP